MYKGKPNVPSAHIHNASWNATNVTDVLGMFTIA